MRRHQGIRYSAPMNFSHSKTVEARSAAALHLKVISYRAAGWVVDGPVLQVTGFHPGKRSTTKYSQGMFKAGLSILPWNLSH